MKVTFIIPSIGRKDNERYIKTMKVTFIIPSVGKKDNERYIKTWQMEPLSIAQLAGLTPDSIEMQFFDDRLEQIKYDEPTDLVAISVETYTARRAYQISTIYRKKGIKVILGGFHPTLIPEEAIEYADSVLIGEAEGLWNKVLQDAEDNKLKKFYKSDVRFSLDGLRPNRDIFNGKKYLPLSLVESARGCSFMCNFCSVSSFYKQAYKCRPISEVVKEIKDLKRENIFLIDDNIGVNRTRTKELFEALTSCNVRWIGQISINLLKDDELVSLMAKSGCICVLIGFESLDSHNLEQMNKSWNNKSAYEEVVQKLRDKGIVMYATFLFGYDYDNLDSFNRVLEFTLKHKFFLVAFNHLIPFPGTALYEKLYNEGRILHDRWWLDSDYRFGDIPFQPKNFSPQELSELCLNFRKKFYSFPSILRRSIDYKANCKNIHMLSTFFSLNLLLKKEVMQRYGLPIGKINHNMI